MEKSIINQENVLNPEILRCLRMVLTHESYNSCNDLAPLFQRMFAGQKVAGHFSLGKTKSRDTMLWNCTWIQKDATLQCKSSPLCSISFEESLNSELQMCQMDVTIRFGNEKKG